MVPQQNSTVLPTTPNTNTDRKASQYWGQQHPVARQENKQHFDGSTKQPSSTEINEALSIVSQWLQQAYQSANSAQNQAGSPVSPIPSSPSDGQDHNALVKRSSRIRNWLRSNKQGLNFRSRRISDNGDDKVTDLFPHSGLSSDVQKMPMALPQNTASVCELDASVQQILELPAAEIELDSVPCEPPSYSSLDPAGEESRRPAGTGNGELPVELDAGAVVFATQATPKGTPSQGVTQLNSAAPLLRRIKDKRQKYRTIITELSKQDVVDPGEVQQAFEKLTMVANKQRQTDGQPEPDPFWEGFWEVLHDQESVELDQNQRSAFTVEPSDAIKSCGCDHLDSKVAGSCGMKFLEGELVRTNLLRQSQIFPDSIYTSRGPTTTRMLRCQHLTGSRTAGDSLASGRQRSLSSTAKQGRSTIASQGGSISASVACQRKSPQTACDR